MGKRSGISVLRNLAKNTKKSKNGSDSSSTSGGYLSSVGHFGGGVMGVVNCDADDDSWYCKLSKFYSSVMMIIFLIGLVVALYFIYKYVKDIRNNQVIRGGRLKGGKR